MLGLSIGMLLLCIYLIVVGVVSLIRGTVISPIITGILALAAGIFLLLGR